MQHGYRPSVEELLQAQLNRPESEISAAPSGFGAVIPQTPQMSMLDLVGLLGLTPMMLGGGKGSAASGMRRGTNPRFTQPGPTHFPESYVAHPNRARALPAPPSEFETTQKASQAERVKGVYQGQLLGLPDEPQWLAAAKAGNPEAIEVLSSRAEQMSSRIAKQFSRQPASIRRGGGMKQTESAISPEEMKAEARKVTLESINTYDPSDPSNASFGTYLHRAIRNRMYNYSLESGFGVETPDHIRRQMAFLNKYDAEAQKRATVSPTRTGEVLPPELASIHMRSLKGRSMAPEKIRELRGRLESPSKLSLSDAELKAQGALQDYMKERKYSPEQSIAELQMLVSQLPPKERQAVEAFIAEGTGTGEAGTTGFREVGQRQGISHEMARKNLNKAVETLRGMYGVKKPKPIPEISGGSGIGEMSGIPMFNFAPELKRLSQGMGGQPSDWTRRQPPAQNMRAATDQPGRDFFFGNPAEDFHPGVAEKQDIRIVGDTYTKLRSLINAMAPYYKHGRQ